MGLRRFAFLRMDFLLQLLGWVPLGWLLELRLVWLLVWKPVWKLGSLAPLLFLGLLLEDTGSRRG